MFDDLGSGGLTGIGMDAHRLNQELTARKLGVKTEQGDEAFLHKRLKFLQSMYQKMENFVDYLLYAVNGIDCFVENEKFHLLTQEMDIKLETMKRKVGEEAFAARLRDLKIKLTSVMRFFHDAIKTGKDDFSQLRTRLDCLFVTLDEILISIQDPNGVLYSRAHACLDFVASFLIFHLGMMCIAEDDFDLVDRGR